MRALAVLIVSAALVHCAETPPPAPPTLIADPAEEPNPDLPPSLPPAVRGSGEPVTGEPPKDCPFRVKEQCYADRDSACQAAGCALDKCRVMESYPAQIACD
jgi:hypothetical protein